MPHAPFLRSTRVRCCWGLMVLAFLCPVELLAQSPAGSHGQLFAITGPGTFSSDHAWYTGGGFEYVRASGFGVGLEAAGAWGFKPDFQGGPGRSTQLVSVYATGQRSNLEARIQPFALAGVGFLSKAISDTELAIVLGAGTNVWIRPGKALRLDLRVPLGLADTGGAVFAAGITIR